MITVDRRRPQRLWTPADTATESWLRPDDASTVTLTGAGVSEIRDMKGNGRNFIQGTAGNRPTLRSGAVNGKTALNLGGSQWLTSGSAASTWNFLHNTTGGIIIALWRAGFSSNPNAVYGLCGTNAASSASTGFFVAYDDRASRPCNDRLITQISRGVNGAATSFNETADNAHPANVATLIAVINDPANAVAANRSLIRINGNTAVQANTLTNAASSANASFALQIGAAGNNALPLVGELSEFVILPLSAGLATAELVEGYLAGPAEYNLQSILAAGHPFKSAAPMV